LDLCTGTFIVKMSFSEPDMVAAAAFPVAKLGILFIKQVGTNTDPFLLLLIKKKYIYIGASTPARQELVCLLTSSRFVA
jgi:hypothetical protein